MGSEDKDLKQTGEDTSPEASSLEPIQSCDNKKDSEKQAMADLDSSLSECAEGTSCSDDLARDELAQQDMQAASHAEADAALDAPASETDEQPKKPRSKSTLSAPQPPRTSAEGAPLSQEELNDSPFFDAEGGRGEVPPQAPSSSFSMPQEKAAKQAKKRKLYIGLAVAAVMLLIVLPFTLFAGGCIGTLLDDEVQNYELITYPGSSNKAAIAVVDIDGMISYDGSTNSPEGFQYVLDQASNDDNILALILRVNSGGGMAAAGEEMAAMLRTFDKPVIVSSQAINASAAYEISSQADYIMVGKTTDIGAIGTLMQVTDLSGLYEKLGIRKEAFTSAPSKDALYDHRSLTEEERAYYQAYITEINEPFIENVRQGRHLTEDEARALANGLTWAGTTAVTNGIADAIGYFRDAQNKAIDMVEEEMSERDVETVDFVKLDVVNHRSSFSLMSLFGLDDLLDIFTEKQEESLAKTQALKELYGTN